jgi:hypothetical protein
VNGRVLCLIGGRNIPPFGWPVTFFLELRDVPVHFGL